MPVRKITVSCSLHQNQWYLLFVSWDKMCVPVFFWSEIKHLTNSLSQSWNLIIKITVHAQKLTLMTSQQSPFAASFLPALNYLFAACLTSVQSAADTPHTTVSVHSNTKPAISIKGVGNCWVPGDKYKQIHPEKGGKLANSTYSQRRWGGIFYSGLFERASVNAPCQAKCITDALRFCNWSWKWIAERPGLNWMT